MKKTWLGINIFLTACIIVLIYLGATDFFEAQKVKHAVDGGYETLLQYENRENSETFISKEAYVYEKSLKYESVYQALYHRVCIEIIGCVILLVFDVRACLKIRKMKIIKS